MTLVTKQTRPEMLVQLEIELAQLAGLVETNLSKAIAALERRDLASARAVISADQRIDALYREIDGSVYATLSRSALSPTDVREVMAIIKTAGDLERVGDLTRTVAWRTEQVLETALEPHHGGVTRLGRASLRQLSDVLNAYTLNDLTAARAVWSGDTDVDELYQSVLRDINHSMREDPDCIAGGISLIFMVKAFERIADHAINIAESLHFFLTETRLEETAGGDKTQGQSAISPIIQRR